MTPRSKPTKNPPDCLGAAGAAFWKSTLEVYFLEDAHHLALLTNACLCLDRAASARAEIEKTGVVTTNRFGELREHPSMNTERQAMQVFRQTVRELGFDLDDGPAAPPRPGTKR